MFLRMACQSRRAPSPESEGLTHPWLQANSHLPTETCQSGTSNQHHPVPWPLCPPPSDFLRACFAQGTPTERILCLLIQIGHNGRADGTGELSKTRTQSTTCFQKQNGSSWNVQSNGTDRSQSQIQGNCVLNSNPRSWLINMKGHCFCISHS